MPVSPFDTIAAVSTPYGKGGVALIRLSGDGAREVAARVFFPANGKPLDTHPPRTQVYGTVRDPDSGEVLDDGLCTLFPAPHSFTGEDTAELCCHGGVLITRNVLEACLRGGARQALAGEFTHRAFLNGKMDLERAEALGNLLDAGNDSQLKLARAGMNGLLTDSAEEVYGELMAVYSNMEAGMDFPEEDLTELTRGEMVTALTAAHRRVEGLIATYRTGHAIAEGIPAAICGRPNVGKSAFYNRLLGREAAIVTDLAGTTRDVLTDTVTLGRVTLRLSDTAGLRETLDPVERIGVERARRAAEEAELVFLLSDRDTPDPEELTLYRELTEKGRTVIPVRTKSDLAPVTPPLWEGTPAVCVSSREGVGFDDLSRAVETAYVDGDLRMGEEAVVFSARQAAALRECAVCLDTAARRLAAGLPYDICADDLAAALSELGTLCGRETREDVISEIFSRFCVGK